MNKQALVERVVNILFSRLNEGNKANKAAKNKLIADVGNKVFADRKEVDTSRSHWAGVEAILAPQRGQDEKKARNTALGRQYVAQHGFPKKKPQRKPENSSYDPRSEFIGRTVDNLVERRSRGRTDLLVGRKEGHYTEGGPGDDTKFSGVNARVRRKVRDERRLKEVVDSLFNNKGDKPKDIDNSTITQLRHGEHKARRGVKTKGIPSK
jgi:hypothetical protein